MRTIASQLPHIKWVFPSAPERSITAWKGDSRRRSSTRGWLDVLHEPLMYSSEYDDIQEYDEGIMQSVKHLDAFIKSEIDSGISEGRVVLGGFGQGGAIALIAGLGGSQWRGASDTKDGWKLGGIISLGGWLPVREKYNKVRGNLQMQQEAVSYIICSGWPCTHLQYPCSGAMECRMNL